MKPGLLAFGFVSAQSQVLSNMLLRQASPKAKIPGSEWLLFFLIRSKSGVFS
jgi:hypothetical protein